MAAGWMRSRWIRSARIDHRALPGVGFERPGFERPGFLSRRRLPSPPPPGGGGCPGRGGRGRRSLRRSRKTKSLALGANAVACNTARIRYREARGDGVPRFWNPDGLARTREAREVREAGWKERMNEVRSEVCGFAARDGALSRPCRGTLPRRAGEGKAGGGAKGSLVFEEKAANRWSGKKAMNRFQDMELAFARTFAFPSPAGRGRVPRQGRRGRRPSRRSRKLHSGPPHSCPFHPASLTSRTSRVHARHSGFQKRGTPSPCATR
jgi:hypothetical protein